METIFATRRRRVIEAMEEDSVLFLFAGNVKQRSLDGDYPFCVNRNYYYLTGLDQPEYVLEIVKQGGHARQTLYLPRPDPYLELYFGAMPTAEQIQAQLGVDRAIYLDKMDWELNRLFSRNYFRTLYMDFHKRELNN